MLMSQLKDKEDGLWSSHHSKYNAYDGEEKKKCYE